MAIDDSVKVGIAGAAGVAIPVFAAPYIDVGAGGVMNQVPYIGPMLGAWGSYSAMIGLVGGAVSAVAGYKGWGLHSKIQQDGAMAFGIGLMAGGIISGLRPAATVPAAGVMMSAGRPRVIGPNRAPVQAMPQFRAGGNF